MLVTVILPFCDFRRIMAPDAKLLPKPRWPSPDAGHLRGIGGVRQRFLPGFDSWIGEGSLVTGVPGMKLDLPRHLRLDGRPRVSLIRKACYFDGLLNGRFEFLFSLSPEPISFAYVSAVARALLERPVVVPRIAAEKGQPHALAKRSPAAAWLWANATVPRGEDSLVRHVRAGRPFVVAESEATLGKVADYAMGGIKLTIDRAGKPFELFTIYPARGTVVGRMSEYRSFSRTLRTYLLRLLQDVEAISQLCEVADSLLDEDRVQFVINEYTRHIDRSKQAIDDGNEALVAYCYAAFGRLYPGSLDRLRVRIIDSNIRGNVKKKLLALLKSAAGAHAIEVHVEGDLVMRDKYGDISATGQGIAIGTGATATVTGSVNQSLDPQLIAALLDLASKVRDSGQENAGIEAECIETAAKKAEEGDEKGAIAYLKKTGAWALGLATTVGSTVLSAFLKAHLGLP